MQDISPPAAPAEGIVHHGQGTPRDSVNVCGPERSEVVEVTPEQVKQRMLKYYGGGERKIITRPIEAGYESENAVAFALEGTPPKGHAMYYDGHNDLWFYDTKGFMYEHWSGVKVVY